MIARSPLGRPHLSKVRERYFMKYAVIVGSVVSTLPSAAMSAPAVADYNGLTIQKHITVDVNGSMYDVWRLYANFTDPGDRLVTGFGRPTMGAITLQTRNFNDTAFGNPF